MKLNGTENLRIRRTITNIRNTMDKINQAFFTFPLLQVKFMIELPVAAVIVLFKRTLWIRPWMTAGIDPIGFNYLINIHKESSYSPYRFQPLEFIASR